MRVVMFISSQYGLECYETVNEIHNIEITGILTTPPCFVLKYDKNKTKEMVNTIYQEVIRKSKENNIPIYVTDKINSEKTINIIRDWKPDLIVVSGWYHIIKETILNIPPKGVIGLHSSLLPCYRGGAPLVWQIINGEKTSGITLFYIEQGTDTGDIIGQKEVVIEENDDIGTLYKKIGEKGIELLIKYIPQIVDNCAPRKKQVNIGEHSVYPQRKKEDGHIDWSKKPIDIYNFIRAQTRPYPGAFSIYEGHQISIWKCKIVTIENNYSSAGTIIDIWEQDEKKCPVIATQERQYGIEILDYSLELADMNIKVEREKKLI